MPKASSIQIDLTANLIRWRAFLCVAQEGSITRAALDLGGNAASLSRHVTALELQCGGRLFERTGRGVRLTELGARLLPQVQDLLARADRLEQDIRGEGPSPSGTVTLALMPSLACAVVGPLFSGLRRQHPNLRLRVLEGSSGKVEELLADGRADIGLLYRYGQPIPAHETALMTAETCLVAAAGDRVTAGPTVPFRRLAGLPLVLPGAPNGLRQSLEAHARAARIVLSPIIENDSLLLLKRLAADEGLYVFLSAHAVADEVAAGTLQSARIVDPQVLSTVSMLHRKSKDTSRAIAVVAARLRELVATFQDGRGRLSRTTGAAATAPFPAGGSAARSSRSS